MNKTLFSILALPGILLAAWLRFKGLGDAALWYDETWTAHLVSMPFDSMMTTIPSIESTPPLFYILLWTFVNEFGFQESDMRMVSALAGMVPVLLIPLVFWPLRLLWREQSVKYAKDGKPIFVHEKPAGLILPLVVLYVIAANPILIWYSQEARAYSLLIAFSSVMIVSAVFYIGYRSRMFLIVWSLAAALGLATHYFAFFAIGGSLVTMLVFSRKTEVLWAAVPSFLVGCGLVPLMLTQSKIGNAGWIAGLDGQQRIESIVPHFLGGFAAPVGIIWVLFGVLTLASLVGLIRSHDKAAWLSFMPFVLGFLAVLGLALFGQDQILVRNLLALFPLFLVALVGGLTFAWPWLRIIGLACLVAVFAIGIMNAKPTPDNQKPDWRQVVTALDQKDQLVVSFYHHPYPLSYYDPSLVPNRDKQYEVDQVQVISFPQDIKDKQCYWGGMCNIYASKQLERLPRLGWHKSKVENHGWFVVETFVARKKQLIGRKDLLKGLTTKPRPIVYFDCKNSCSLLD